MNIDDLFGSVVINEAQCQQLLNERNSVDLICPVFQIGTYWNQCFVQQLFFVFSDLRRVMSMYILYIRRYA